MKQGAKKTKWASLVTWLLISLLFENLSLFTIFGGHIKLYHLVAIIGIILSMFEGVKIIRKNLICFLVFAIVPLMPLYRINDISSFISTYFMYLLFLIFLLLCFDKVKMEFCKNICRYMNLLKNIMMIAAWYGVLQFIAKNFFGVDALDNIFGGKTFQILEPGITLGFERAKSLFHEPSYFGIVCCIGLAIALYINHIGIYRFTIGYFISICIGILVSLSTASYFVAVFIVIAYAFSIKRINMKHIVATLFMIVIALFLLNTTDISRVFAKIDQFGRKGTSGYERLISPFEYARQTFVYYPLLGRGMGQEGNIDKVGIIGMYSGVNNSIFGVLVFFGLFAFAFYGMFIKTAKEAYKANRVAICVIAALLGMYFSTGAFLAFDTYMLLVVGVLVMKIKVRKEDLI